MYLILLSFENSCWLCLNHGDSGATIHRSQNEINGIPITDVTATMVAVIEYWDAVHFALTVGCIHRGCDSWRLFSKLIKRDNVHIWKWYHFLKKVSLPAGLLLKPSTYYYHYYYSFQSIKNNLKMIWWLLISIIFSIRLYTVYNKIIIGKSDNIKFNTYYWWITLDKCGNFKHMIPLLKKMSLPTGLKLKSSIYYYYYYSFHSIKNNLKMTKTFNQHNIGDCI